MSLVWELTELAIQCNQHREEDVAYMSVVGGCWVEDASSCLGRPLVHDSGLIHGSGLKRRS